MVTQRIAEAPPDFPGTLPEWLVFQELTRLKIDFDFQSSQLGGRQTRGGSVADFYIPDRNLIINVMSLFWHYGRPEGIQNDRLQREALLAQGLNVIYIDEEGLLRNARFLVAEALELRDHSLMTREIR